MCIFVLVQLLILSEVHIANYVIWAVYGFFGGSGILCYTVFAERAPSALIGRLNTAMTLLIFSTTFLLQIAIGWILNFWPTHGGQYPAIAHKVVWVGLISFQVLSAIAFIRPVRQSFSEEAVPLG
jgi:hypothetical protein